MTKPLCITFAGVPGSSKSIIAYYLSEKFALPIFSNDNIRFEVCEDLRTDNINIPKALHEFERRSTARQEWLLQQRKTFIRDASADRSWPRVHSQLERAGYSWFIISLDLSKDFIVQLYRSTGRDRAVEALPSYLKQHQDFIADNPDEIGLSITDNTFARRTTLAEAALRKFIEA